MRGFVAYVALVASVAMLIPWPYLWPLAGAVVVVCAFAPITSNRRTVGGKRREERD